MTEYYHSISISIQDVSITIKSNNIEFVDYLNKHFHSISRKSENPDIAVFLNWQESIYKNAKPYEFKNLQDLKIIGRRILIGDNNIVWNEIGEIRGLKLHILYDNKVEVRACYDLNLSKFLAKRFYKQVVRRRSFRRYKEDIYEGLTYYLVYYPILFQLERRYLFPLHGSALTFEGKSILMPGLPGVGKSTLCLAFLSYKNSMFISDNIVLYDDRKIYSFFEPIRLDRTSLGLLPDKGKTLVEMGIESYYGRHSYRVEDNKTINEIVPEFLIIPCRADENGLTQISSEQAVQLILDFNRIAGEINSYFTYSSVQNMCLKKESIDLARVESLYKLVDNLKCYLLFVKSNCPMEAIIKQIESKIF